MSKVLMFDLGGVLVINDMFDELQGLLENKLTNEALKAKWLKSPAVREFELGRCAPMDFADAMVAEFRLSVCPEEFITAFSGWPKGFYSGAQKLLSDLRQRYLTCCLSNSNGLHWCT